MKTLQTTLKTLVLLIPLNTYAIDFPVEPINGMQSAIACQSAVVGLSELEMAQVKAFAQKALGDLGQSGPVDQWHEKLFVELQTSLAISMPEGDAAALNEAVSTLVLDREGITKYNKDLKQLVHDIGASSGKSLGSKLLSKINIWSPRQPDVSVREESVKGIEIKVDGLKTSCEGKRSLAISNEAKWSRAYSAMEKQGKKIGLLREIFEGEIAQMDQSGLDKNSIDYVLVRQYLMAISELEEQNAGYQLVIAQYLERNRLVQSQHGALLKVMRINLPPKLMNLRMGLESADSMAVGNETLEALSKVDEVLNKVNLGLSKDVLDQTKKTLELLQRGAKNKDAAAIAGNLLNATTISLTALKVEEKARAARIAEYRKGTQAALNNFQHLPSALVGVAMENNAGIPTLPGLEKVSEDKKPNDNSKEKPE